MEKLRELISRVDNLSIRERGIIFLAVLFILYSAWDSFFMRPMSVKEGKIAVELKQKRAERLVLHARLQQLATLSKTDPDAANRKKLNELKSQIAAIDSDIKTSAQYLIAPKSMAKILETMLLKTKGLRLIEIKGLGVQPLVPKPDKEKETMASGAAGLEKTSVPGIGNAYKHGLRISFEGNYLSTLAYIRELESLQWGFFWDQFEFEVKNYPEGQASITVYTLSLDKDWIGV